jgi:transcriptional regulator with XRE-family HTH domain
VSLRQLARQAGVSASLLSQIENGKNKPSVSTLYALTSVLGVFVDDLFQGRAGPAEAHRPGASEDHRSARAAARLGASIGRTGPLVHPREREVLVLDSGVTWERLGQLPDRHVDFLLVTYAPGGTSSSAGGLMRHQGSEYGYLLSGELILTLGFDELRLRPGDAISFESPTPHGYRNDGTEPAAGVWFVTESPKRSPEVATRHDSIRVEPRSQRRSGS